MGRKGSIPWNKGNHNPKRKRFAFLKARFEVFKRDNFTCQYCGRTIKDGVKLVTDHINPQKHGGVDKMNNLKTACEECNTGKGDVLLNQRATFKNKEAE